MQSPIAVLKIHSHISTVRHNKYTLQSGIEDLITVTNDDDPEALLDGLLQSAVCDELIGWRRESRKLILAFTDRRYHTAGDGRVSLSCS